MREWVLARVKELDSPNLAARVLGIGGTDLVGLGIPDLLDPFFAEIAKSVSEVLRHNRYYLIGSSSEESESRGRAGRSTAGWSPRCSERCLMSFGS